MPRLFGKFEVILACSVIISAIFISFFLPLPSRPPPITPISPISPTPIDSTPNWITYNNPSNRFSLKFPQDWTKDAEEDLANSALTLITNSSSSIYFLLNEQTPYLLDISPDKTEKIYVNGQPTVHQIFTMSQESTIWHSYTFINNPGYSIEARIHPIDEETFFQILSTFKLMNQKAPTTNNKFCIRDQDCTLLTCSGCFNKDWAETAPPDLPCMTYSGYSCNCTNSVCTESK